MATSMASLFNTWWHHGLGATPDAETSPQGQLLNDVGEPYAALIKRWHPTPEQRLSEERPPASERPGVLLGGIAEESVEEERPPAPPAPPATPLPRQPPSPGGEEVLELPSFRPATTRGRVPEVRCPEDDAEGPSLMHAAAAPGRPLEALEASPEAEAEAEGAGAEAAQRPGTGGEQQVEVGELVEYYCEIRAAWIPAKVVDRTADGVYSLTCGSDAPLQMIWRRAPPGAAAAAPRAGVVHRVGETVEYLSTTLKGWIPTRVLAVSPEGTYILECRPNVPPERVRQWSGGARASSASISRWRFTYWSGSGGGLATQESLPQQTPRTPWLQPADASSPASGAGAASSSGGAALGASPSGSGQRRLASNESVAEGAEVGGPFEAGELVEYYSKTQGTWIPAKVLTAGHAGTYDLDCKPEALAERIRRRGAAGVAHAGEYRVGDIVSYFSTSLQSWIPAKVLWVNDNGTYALDCKPAVPADKVRLAKAPSRKSRSRSRSASPAQSKLGASRSCGSSAPACPAAAAGPAAGAAASPLLGGGRPVRLIAARESEAGWQFEACAAGLAALERLGTRRVAVASVCGPDGSGKSVLLNALAEPMLQATDGEADAGIWLWGALGEPREHQPLLVLLGCRGVNGAGGDDTPDSKLMAVCALLSSVLVLNSKSSLSEGLLCAFALASRFHEHLEDFSEDVSRPHLLWVLRDFIHLAGGRGAAWPDEYLERALQSGPAAQRGALGFFARRGCATLPRPGGVEGADFREGIRALKEQVVASCCSNSKVVGGQPLGGFSLAALLRRFAAALSGGEPLSLRRAWGAVQHSSCQALATELRGEACKALRALAAGQTLPGGAKLPMADEALRVVLRDRRRLLKAQWDERAVGDEPVRREYWQELKELLAEEEQAVGFANSKLAEEQLQAALSSWQEWLDKDESPEEARDRMPVGLRELLERVPAGSLLRASRAAIEEAAHRVTVARSAVARSAGADEATTQQQLEPTRKGRAAFSPERVVRFMDGAPQSLAAGDGGRGPARRSGGRAAQSLVQDELSELQSAKAQLHAALRDVERCAEEARARALELRSEDGRAAQGQSVTGRSGTAPSTPWRRNPSPAFPRRRRPWMKVLPPSAKGKAFRGKRGATAKARLGTTTAEWGDRQEDEEDPEDDTEPEEEDEEEEQPQPPPPRQPQPQLPPQPPPEPQPQAVDRDGLPASCLSGRRREGVENHIVRREPEARGPGEPRDAAEAARPSAREALRPTLGGPDEHPRPVGVTDSQAPFSSSASSALSRVLPMPKAAQWRAGFICPGDLPCPEATLVFCKHGRACKRCC